MINLKSKLVLMVSLVIILSGGSWAGWTTQETGTASDFNALYFPSNTLGIAVGNSGTIYRNADGANTWESKSIGTADYNDLIAPGESEIWVLGTNGKVLKSTDKGLTFPDVVFGAFSTANFKKGSFQGAYRAIAANVGANADSSLLYSTNEGTTWGTTSLTSIEIEGVFLGSSESAAPNVWTWGKNYSSNLYVIQKNLTTVYSGPTAVKDVFFSSKNVGYAVGDSGLVLKAGQGGDSGDWTPLSFGQTKNLKAVSFISDLVGWAVGDSGTISFTVDGGLSWASYTIDNTSTNLKDIFTRQVSSGSSSVSAASIRTSSVHSAALTQVLALISGAFLPGPVGSILKLSSPTVTSVSPSSKMQGYLGTLEVTGKGFISGAYMTFYYPAGSSTTDSNIGVISYTYEAGAKVTANILIKTGASTGLRDIVVTNPDGTAVKASNAFTVLASTGTVSFESIWLDLHKYITTSSAEVKNTMTVQPTVTYEVSTTNAGGITIANAKARLVTEISTSDASGSAYVVSVLPATAETQISASKIGVAYTVPTHEKLPDYSKGSKVRFMLYAEDNAGNVGLVELWVDIARELKGGENLVQILPGTQEGIPCLIGTLNNTVDPEKGTYAWIRVPDSYDISSFTVKIVDAYGKQVYEKKFGGASASGVESYRVKSAQTASGEYVKQMSWFIPPMELSSGTYLAIVYGPNGILAKNKFTVWKNIL